jgi:hypothetical protein
VRIHAHKVVVLQYMEPAGDAHMDARGQAILDGVRTY